MVALPTPRACVAAIPPYVPGRTPTARPGRTTYKLSSNENPYAPLPGVLAAATGAAEQLNRYPDMGCTVLYDTLAQRFALPTERFAAATGSVALIYQLLQAFCDPGDEVVHAWRSFEAYPIAIGAAAAVGVPVPVTDRGEHDLEAMAAAVTDRTKVVLLCTPNNPTGPALTDTAVRRFLARVPSHVLVVVDEAYVEFVRMTDAVDGFALLRDFPNVALTRTFSKAYGLANLRVGFAASSAEIAGALRAVSLPFGVSGIAQAAAIASLAAEAELLERVDGLVRERQRVLSGLREAGWNVPDAQGNFVWFDLPDETGARTAAFAEAAEEAGIVVRPFAGEGVRVSIGEAEANSRLLRVATQLVGRV